MTLPLFSLRADYSKFSVFSHMIAAKKAGYGITLHLDSGKLRRAYAGGGKLIDGRSDENDDRW